MRAAHLSGLCAHLNGLRSCWQTPFVFVFLRDLESQLVTARMLLSFQLDKRRREGPARDNTLPSYSTSYSLCKLELVSFVKIQACPEE